MLNFEKLFFGTVGECVVYPRKVVKSALACNATKAILVHNHPAGTGVVNIEDIKTTISMKEAPHCIDVSLLDHYIVSGTKTKSLRKSRYF